MSSTSPKTRLPQHSTGWRAIRIVTDRAGKNQATGPADWLRAKHRDITTVEAAELIRWRIQGIRQVTPLIRK